MHFFYFEEALKTLFYRFERFRPALDKNHARIGWEKQLMSWYL